METVQHYLEVLQEEGEETFLERFAHPFLLYPEKRSAGGFATYHTRMADRSAGASISGSGKEIRQFRVLPPNPQLGQKYPAKMIIGRSPERDFSVDHSTVSKRHAVIMRDAQSDSYRLGDAGSTNGTFINGQAVEAGEPVYLRDGFIVSFGDCDYMFFSPGGFVQLLKRLAQDG